MIGLKLKSECFCYQVVGFLPDCLSVVLKVEEMKRNREEKKERKRERRKKRK